jgi:hypothetical protein
MMMLTWIWIVLFGLVTATSQASELVHPCGPVGPTLVSQSTAAKRNADGAVGVIQDGGAQGDLILVQSSGRGSKYTDKSGKFIILSLQGTFREMGRQYGALLSEEIRKMNQKVLRQYALNKVVIPGERLVSFSKRLFRLYPARFKEQARGISEGGNIDLDTLAINSEFFDYFLKPNPFPAKSNQRMGLARPFQPRVHMPGTDLSSWEETSAFHPGSRTSLLQSDNGRASPLPFGPRQLVAWATLAHCFPRHTQGVKCG